MLKKIKTVSLNLCSIDKYSGKSDNCLFILSTPNDFLKNLLSVAIGLLINLYMQLILFWIQKNHQLLFQQGCLLKLFVNN
jgi:hypothetical protein